MGIFSGMIFHCGISGGSLDSDSWDWLDVQDFLLNHFNPINYHFPKDADLLDWLIFYESII